MADDPISSAIVDGAAVAKGDVRTYENTRNRIRVTATELRNGDFSAVSAVEIGGLPYDRDTSDTTSADDGAWVYVDAVGTRFRRIVNSREFDAVGDITNSPSDRDQYDDEAEGFTFFSLSEGGYYYKLSAGDADWSSLVSLKGADGASYFDILVNAVGPLGDGETFFGVIMARAASFPAGLTGSQAKAGAAATAETVIALKKNGTQFGTVTFAAAGTSGAFAAASETTFAAGDVLTAVGPSPADATLADLRITLTGAL